MTMPHERTRAVIQTRVFLFELTRNSELPEDVRSSAKHLLRHYPSAAEVLLAGEGEERLASTTGWSNIFSSGAELRAASSTPSEEMARPSRPEAIFQFLMFVRSRDQSTSIAGAYIGLSRPLCTDPQC
jgi:hypothetical protein